MPEEHSQDWLCHPSSVFVSVADKELTPPATACFLSLKDHG
jgi:hypothetical protein